MYTLLKIDSDLKRNKIIQENVTVYQTLGNRIKRCQCIEFHSYELHMLRCRTTTNQIHAHLRFQKKKKIKATCIMFYKLYSGFKKYNSKKC